MAMFDNESSISLSLEPVSIQLLIFSFNLLSCQTPAQKIWDVFHLFR